MIINKIVSNLTLLNNKNWKLIITHKPLKHSSCILLQKHKLWNSKLPSISSITPHYPIIITQSPNLSTTAILQNHCDSAQMASPIASTVMLILKMEPNIRENSILRENSRAMEFFIIRVVRYAILVVGKPIVSMDSASFITRVLPNHRSRHSMNPLIWLNWTGLTTRASLVWIINKVLVLCIWPMVINLVVVSKTMPFKVLEPSI